MQTEGEEMARLGLEVLGFGMSTGRIEMIFSIKDQ